MRYDAWTAAEETKLRELWAGSLSFAEIAKKIGRSAIACKVRAQKLRLLRGKSCPWKLSQEKELRRLWDTNLSCAQIAARIGGGLTRQAIIGKAQRLDLPQRKDMRHRTSVWTPSRVTQLRTLYPTDTPVSEIAARIGIAEVYVRLKASKLGLRRPQRKATKRETPDWEPSLARDIPITDYDPPEHERVSLLDLKLDMCRWPIDGKFCGRPTCSRGSGSYCEHHAARAYQGITKPREMRPDDGRKHNRFRFDRRVGA